MIEMKNLGKAYGSKETATVALDHVNLTIDQGEFVAIMGKSGAGKSTLLHILGGLDTFDSGEYRLMGKNVGAMKDNSLSQLRNETIGFVMQDFALISEKTALFNTMLPLFFDRTPWSKMKAQGLAALERVGVTRNFSITLAVTLRFLPALGQDFRHIRDAMALRRIRGLEQKLECVYVPMLMRAAQTAEELSQSATARGIEHPGKRSSWRPIGFHLWDGVVMLLFLFLCMGGICCKGVLP